MYAKDEMETPFKLVTKKDSSKFLPNPLFHTVLKLKDSGDPIVSNLQIKRKVHNQREVLYIILKKPDVTVNIPNYEFEESHLTIHEDYREKQTRFKNGLGLIHCTHIYNHQTADNSIVIHEYFTRQGFHHYIQTKKYSGKRSEDNYTELYLDEKQKEETRESGEEASTIITNLLQQKYYFYNEAVQKAAVVEHQLATTGKKKSKEAIVQYIELGQKFVELMNDVNKFSDVPDARGLFVAREIQFLKEELERKQKFITPTEDKTPIGSDSPISSATPNHPPVLVASKKSNDYYYFEEKLKEIALKKEKLDALKSKTPDSKNDLSSLAEQIELINALRLDLLLISSCRFSMNQVTQTLIKDVTQSVDESPDLLDMFTHYFWDGDLDAVEKIYPYVKHSISIDYILEKIIYKLLVFTPGNPEQEIRLKQVFDFLSEHSNSYALIVQTGTALISLKDSKILRSLLVVSCRERNIFAFKLFLEHGMHPNGLGMIFNEVQIPAIFAISVLSQQPNCPFLELAIEFGAHYTAKITPLKLDIRRTPKSSISVFKQSKAKHTIEEFNKLFEVGVTLIDFCNKTRNYNAMEHFLPRMSSNFEEMLSLFAKVVDDSEIGQRYVVPSLVTGAKVVKEMSLLDEMYARTLDLESTSGLYSVLIFSPKNPEALKVIEKLLVLINQEISTLSSQEPSKLHELQAKFLENTKTISTSNVTLSEMSQKFNMSFFLLISDPNPSFMVHQSVLQLLCRRAAFAKNSPSFYAQTPLYYHSAKVLAETSPFAKELMKTPLYGFINKHLAVFTTSNSPEKIGKGSLSSQLE